jgi:DNA replication protein DnaC
MMPVRKINGEGNCDVHGTYQYTAFKSGNLIVGQVCPDCLAARQIERSEKHAGDLKERQERKLIERMRQAGIPPLFEHSTFDNYEALIPESQYCLQVMRQYAAGFAGILAEGPATGAILVGNPGTGKTHLACGLIRSLIENGYSARYASIPALLSELREANRGAHDMSVSAVIRELASVQLLVLDEYGIHTQQAVDYQLLFQLVDARYRNNVPTIMLTNVHLAEVSRELDERFLERIRGRYVTELVFDWNSWREKRGVQEVFGSKQEKSVA